MKTPRFNLPGFAPWLVLTLGFIATFVGWQAVRDDDTSDTAVKFEAEVVGHITAIQNRMLAYEQILRAGVAFTNSSDEVTRQEWKTFVDNLRVQKNYPGTLGYAYSIFVPHDEVAAHEARMQAEGFSDYRIRPIDPRLPPTAIIYLEPLNDRNRAAIGYNMFKEPNRLAAMTRAVETGNAALAGRVTLVQENKGPVQAGTLMYLPVYKKGVSLETVADRWAAIVGVVYAPLRMNDLMNGILGDRQNFIDLHIFDGDSMDEANLMHDSDGVLNHAEKNELHRTEVVEIAGQKWTLDFHATPKFIAAFDHTRPWIVAIGGTFGSLLLFGFVYGLTRARGRAVELAEQMTMELRTSEAQKTVILDTAVNAIVTMGADRLIRTFNPAAEQLFGYTADEVLGRNVNILMPEPYHTEHDKYVADHIQTGEKKIIGSGREVIGRRKDGTTFPLWLSVGSAMLGEERLFVGCIVDISERKMAEEKIRTLSLAVEQSPSVVIITNPAGSIIYTNPRFTEVTGYTAAEVLGQNPRLLKTGHTPLEGYATIWQTLLVGEIWRGEMLNRKKNDDLYWAAVAIAPIRDESGAITGFVSLQEDITVRKEAESQLIAAKEAAEQSNRAKSDFLNTMSHELRTPLTVILGYLPLLIAARNKIPAGKKLAALLAEQPEALAEFEKFVGQISKMTGEVKKNGDHLLTLINDILDLSKIEAGKLTLNRENFPAKQVVQGVIDALHDRAEAKGLHLTGEAGEEKIFADEVRVKQIFFNLVGNAVKFTETGEITITTRQLGNFVEFAVTDTGPGIPSDQLEAIFDRFTQVDNTSTRKAGGTGLGLTITRQLVTLHGGTVRVESQEGVGSTFIFTIPLAGEE